MIPIQGIDSIYYTKSNELVDTETQEGIRIFIDSKGKSDCNYYRWTYEEWWKIDVPNPKKYNFVDEFTFTECSPIKKICWGHEHSHDIIIKSSVSGISNPILFVASNETSRLLIQYFIKVRQFSISKGEYEFWDLMKQVSESGGDIFDKQPFQISGNIHNINNPDEQVLGYFQVSGAREVSRYITKKEIEELGLSHYSYPCNTIVVGPKDIPTEGNMPPPSIGTIYAMYSSGDLVFIEPLWGAEGVESLVFSAPLCADCTKSGSLKKPDFWVDIY